MQVVKQALMLRAGEAPRKAIPCLLFFFFFFSFGHLFLSGCINDAKATCNFSFKCRPVAKKLEIKLDLRPFR